MGWLAAVAVAVLLPATPAQAAEPWSGLPTPLAAAADTDPVCDKSWDGGATTTSWWDAANWAPDGVPNGVRACLPDGAYTVDLQSQAHNLTGLTVGAGVTFAVAASINAPGGSVINRGKIQILNAGELHAGSMLNDTTGVVEDAGAITAGNTFVNAPLENRGAIRAHSLLRLRAAGGASASLPGATVTVDDGATLSFEVIASLGLDGAVSSAGTLQQSGGTLTLGNLTHTGAPLRLYGGTLNPGGTGTAAVATYGVVTLAGDVAAGMTVLMRPHVNVSDAYLQLDGDRSNLGRIAMESPEVAAHAVVVGVNGTLPRLTNAGRIEVTKGAGGQRYLRTNLTNTAAGVVDVEGMQLTMDANAALTHFSAGTIDVDSAAGSGISIHGGAQTFTQTGGAIVNGGYLVQSAGTFVHQGGTASGAPVRIQGARLDPSGAGAAAFEVWLTATLAGDVHADASIFVRGTVHGDGTLALEGDRTNHGLIRMESVGAPSNALVGETTTERLTNLGKLEVRAGAGGGRHLRANFTNGSTGLVDVEGVQLNLDANVAGMTYLSSGTWDIDVAAASGVAVYNATPTFTQTGGTIANGGHFVQLTGLHVHQGGTTSGAPLRIQGAQLDPSGPGAPAFEVWLTGTLAGDVHADATIFVRGTVHGDGVLALDGDRTNHGLIRMESVGAPSNALVGESTAERLTNLGKLEVRAGAGGARFLRANFTNGSTGLVDIEGVQLNLDANVAGMTHVSSGAWEIGPEASSGVSIHNATPTFTQTGGTIGNQGHFVQLAGTFLHEGGTTSGAPVRIQGARLDPSGAGAAAFEVWLTGTLAGDVHADATIFVRGTVHGDGTLALDGDRTNHGLIRMESVGAPSNALVGESTTERLTNLGKLEVRAGTGGARFLRANFTNGASGLVDVKGVQLNLDANLAGLTHSSSGIWQIGPEASSGVSIHNATPTFTQTAGTIGNQGHFVQSAGTHVHQGGTLTGAPIRIRNAALNPSGPGGPRFEINAGGVLAGDVHATTTISVIGDNAESGSLRVEGARANHGVVRLQSRDGTAGHAELTSTGVADVLTNVGTLESEAGGSRWLNARVLNEGALSIETYTSAVCCSDQANPILTNDGGSVTVAAAFQPWGGYRQISGSTVLVDGHIQPPRGPGFIAFEGGVLTGNGKLSGPVVNGGEFNPGRPGRQYGRIHIEDVVDQIVRTHASYTQTATGVLAMAVNGTTPDTQHDQLKVDGPITLDGSLEVSRGEYVPGVDPADRFRLVETENGASHTGAFAEVSGLGSGPFDLEYGIAPDAVVLVAKAGPVEPTPTLSIAGAEVTEGDAGSKQMDFTVTLSKALENDVTAEWATVADTATAGSDYTTASGTVSVPAGQTTATISVPILGDAAIEGVETFLVRLRLPFGADLAVARASGRILPDDLGITQVSPQAAGDAGDATVTVRGGGFVPGMDVRLQRAGEADRVGTVLDGPVDGARMTVRFDLDGAERGPWDLRVAEPGAGGDSATEAGAFEVVAAAPPRVAVNVSVPANLRYGWAGRATISLRNDGTNDADVDLVRVLGTDVKLRTEFDDDFTTGDLALYDADLKAHFGGATVIPPGESRRVVVRFMSTTLAPHASLRVDAEVYLADQLDTVLGGDGDPAEHAGRISGHVRDAAGDAIAGVLVSAVSTGSGSGHTGSAVTGPDGAFSMGKLADGTFSVAIGEEPTAAGDRHEVTLGEGGREKTVELTSDVAEVSGSVRAANGDRVAGAEVALLRDGRVVTETRSDGGGGFRFSVLRSGTYEIAALPPGGGLARLGGVEVTAGRPLTGLRPTTGDRTLEVSVAGPGGAVAGATVAVRAAGLEELPLTATTEAGGTVSFAGLPAGEVEVEARHEGLTPAAVTLSPGAGTTQHGFTLATGGALEGTVTGPAGAVPGGRAVAVHRDSGRRHSAPVDASGHYLLSGLAPGTYDVWFQVPGLAPRLVEGVVVTAATQTLDPPALGTDGVTDTLRVESPDGGFVAGALFSLFHAATGVQVAGAMSDGTGTATIGPVPPGAYRVEILVPGSAPVTHDLNVAPGRQARVFDNEQYPPPPETYVPEAEPEDPNPLFRPARVDWLSGIPEPRRMNIHRDGWEYQHLAIEFAQPCPKAVRLRDLLTVNAVVLNQAFDSWTDAWKALEEINSNEVALYMAKSTELALKIWAFGRALKYGTPKGISDLGAAALGLFAGLAGTAAQAQASGEYPDNAALKQAGVEAAVALIAEHGGDYGKGAGMAWGPLSLALDITNLNKELEQVSETVKKGGDRYLEGQSLYHNALLKQYRLLNAFKAAVAECPDPDDDGEPKPGGSGGGVIDNHAPNDPNDILGPAGVGDEKWIPAGQDLGYMIRFENLGPGSQTIPPGQSPATAPAVLVTITHPLDEDVDLDAVELGDVGWGGVDVTVPGGLQTYHADIPQADGDIVRVDGALDRPSRTITWTLATIDGDTGDLQSSVTKGFLPPEDGSGNGQGYVSYGARGEEGLAHATAITAQASIVFDFNPAIQTPVHSNSIDAQAPVSSVTAATQPGAGGAGCTETLAVQWSGTDAGSGLDRYDVWVSADGGPATLWKPGTTATSATFAGEGGHAYRFFSVARDRVGLDEPPPATGDVSATITGCDETAPLTVAAIDGPAPVGGWHPGAVEVAIEGIDDPGGAGVSQLVWSATGATTGGATVASDTVKIPVGADGVTTIEVAGADAAGNAGAARTVVVRVDALAPTVTVASPPEGATLKVGEAATASFACADQHSGMKSCTGTVADGAALDTSSPGTRSITVTATDVAGHAAEVTRTYTVVPAPAATPGPGEPPVAVPPSFSAAPVAIKLARVTSEKRVRFTLTSRERFALTGSGVLTARKRIARPKPFALAALGRATLTLTLDAKTRRALKAGRTVKATLALTLRAGEATRTVRKKVALRLAKRRRGR